MKKKITNFSLIRSTILGAALITFSSASFAAEPAATVNDVTISQELVTTYLSQLPPQKKQSLSQDDIVNELIVQQLLVQDAKKQGFDQNPEVRDRITLLTNNVLAASAVRAYQQAHPVTEEQLKKAYTMVKPQLEAGAKEFQARHILLKTEDEAKAVIAELKKGADFAGLAKEKSTGPSAKDGGDLGWFKAGQMVPEFSAAVAKLKKGEYTSAPVQTQFGWHVIKLEDQKSNKLPTIAQIKPQLTKFIEQKNTQDYIKSLQENAKIIK